MGSSPILATNQEKGIQMANDKAIKSGKEHRKPYRRDKAVDPSCRNHGSDEWSKGNRLIQSRREAEKAAAKLSEEEKRYDG